MANNNIIRNKEELRQFVLSVINDKFAWLDGADLAKVVYDVLDACNYDCCEQGCAECPFRNKLVDGSTEICDYDCEDTMTMYLTERD